MYGQSQKESRWQLEKYLWLTVCLLEPTWMPIRTHMKAYQNRQECPSEPVGRPISIIGKPKLFRYEFSYYQEVVIRKDRRFRAIRKLEPHGEWWRANPNPNGIGSHYYVSWWNQRLPTTINIKSPKARTSTKNNKLRNYVTYILAVFHRELLWYQKLYSSTGSRQSHIFEQPLPSSCWETFYIAINSL